MQRAGEAAVGDAVQHPQAARQPPGAAAISPFHHFTFSPSHHLTPAPLHQAETRELVGQTGGLEELRLEVRDGVDCRLVLMLGQVTITWSLVMTSLPW